MIRFGYMTTVSAMVVAAGCSGDILDVQPPAYMVASLAGAIAGDYNGDGTFTIRPASTLGPRFTLGSRGVGGSASQAFTFHAVDVPAPGDYVIGGSSTGGVIAGYSVRDSNAVRLFTASSGTLRITESTAARGERLSGRMAGTFEGTFALTYDCVTLPGFPGGVLKCEPVEAGETVQVVGSFRAGPLGGDNPGLDLTPR